MPDVTDFADDDQPLFSPSNFFHLVTTPTSVRSIGGLTIRQCGWCPTQAGRVGSPGDHVPAVTRLIIILVSEGLCRLVTFASTEFVYG